MQARQDLYLFGAKPFLDCIQQTLSMDNVLPRNRFVSFDLDDYLGEHEMADNMTNELPQEETPND